MCKRIGILGAGALGSFFAHKLKGTTGVETFFVARGKRFERLSADGIVVNGEPYNIPVVHPDRVADKADVIIVALKHHQLQKALGDLRYLLHDDTVILSVMNGLDSERIIGERYGEKRMLYAVSLGIDALREGNRLTFTHAGKLVFGEQNNQHLSARVLALQQVFERAGIPYETPEDMLQVIWKKFMINVGMNQASAVLGGTYGLFQTSETARALSHSLMHEVIQVAQASGIDLNEDAILEWDEILAGMEPTGKTSMLQDFEAQRQSELTIFAAKVLELGQALEVPTPVNETVWRILSLREAQYVEDA